MARPQTIPEDVIESIKTAQGSVSAIANTFGVSKATVSRIKNDKDRFAATAPFAPSSAPWNQLHRSALNPRKQFDPDGLLGLADSIAAEGIHIPLLVRYRPDGPGFEIIGGERRHRAFEILILRQDLFEFDQLPIKLIDPCDDARFLELVLTENIARRDMTPVEEANLFAGLVERGRSTSDIGQISGLGQRAVQKRLKLLKDLAPSILLELASGGITVEYANVLASHCPQDFQGRMMDMIRNGGFDSADMLEDYLRKVVPNWIEPTVNPPVVETNTDSFHSDQVVKTLVDHENPTAPSLFAEDAIEEPAPPQTIKPFSSINIGHEQKWPTEVALVGLLWKGNRLIRIHTRNRSTGERVYFVPEQTDIEDLIAVSSEAPE